MKNVENTKHLKTPVWGVPEVMAYTGLNRRQVVALADKGRFPTVDTGISRRRFVPSVVVQRWAEIRGVGTEVTA